jgi:RNA polymerase sigma factor (sigma-70 family)
MSPEARRRLADSSARLTEAQRELVEQSMGLVKKLAHGLSRLHGLNEDDAMSVGRLALTESVFHFDPDAGVPLAVFAFQRVRGEILDQAGKDRRGAKLARLLDQVADNPDPIEHDDARVARDLWLLTNALAASIALSACYRPEGPAEALDQAEARARVRSALEAAMNELEVLDRELIQLHYKEGRSLKELVQSGHGAYRTLRRRHQKSLSSLHEKLRAKGVTADDAQSIIGTL